MSYDNICKPFLRQYIKRFAGADTGVNAVFVPMRIIFVNNLQIYYESYSKWLKCIVSTVTNEALLLA